jgi:hypothetical protein
MSTLMIFRLVLVAFLYLGQLCSCSRNPLRANEELRLTENQLALCRSRAEKGDPAAAKKLWHHYTFAVGDLAEGKHWKTVYDDLVRHGPSKRVDD